MRAHYYIPQNAIPLHSNLKTGDIMKRLFILVFVLSTMTLMAQTPINIIVGSKTFTATLADSETGEAFSARLSCTFEKKVVLLHRNSND